MKVRKSQAACEGMQCSGGLGIMCICIHELFPVALASVVVSIEYEQVAEHLVLERL